MTGSGLPLRFYTNAGAPLPVRQLATQLDDHADADQAVVGLGAKALPRDVLVARSRDLVLASARNFHSPLVVANHPGQFFSDPDWLIGILELAEAEKIHVSSVEQYAAATSRRLASPLHAGPRKRRTNGISSGRGSWDATTSPARW